MWQAAVLELYNFKPELSAPEELGSCRGLKKLFQCSKFQVKHSARDVWAVRRGFARLEMLSDLRPLRVGCQRNEVCRLA
jgi:hypothetical protein